MKSKDFNKVFRERMFKSFNPIDEWFKVGEAMLPVVVEEIESQTAHATELDLVSQQTLDDLKRMVNLISSLKESLTKESVAISHYMEGQEVMSGARMELAHLVTLSQFPEIAIKGSTDYVKSLLEQMEIPTFEEALQTLDDERLVLVEAALSRVISKKKG